MRAAKNLRKVPLLGKLFTGTFDAKQKQELVIFVTPNSRASGPPNPHIS